MYRGMSDINLLPDIKCLDWCQKPKRACRPSRSVAHWKTFSIAKFVLKNSFNIIDVKMLGHNRIVKIKFQWIMSDTYILFGLKMMGNVIPNEV